MELEGFKITSDTTGGDDIYRWHTMKFQCIDMYVYDIISDIGGV